MSDTLTLKPQAWFAQDGYVYQDALEGPTICQIEEATEDQVRAITAAPDLVRAGYAVLNDPACAGLVQSTPFQSLAAAIDKAGGGKPDDGLTIVTPEQGRGYVTPEDGQSLTTREG